MNKIEKLKSYSKMKNIAVEGKINKDKLLKIGQRILLGYKTDLSSSSEWLSDVKKVEELASLQAKKKSFPLPNSANIKFPLVTKASYEFSSRTYPEIIRDGKVIKARVIGFDLDGTKFEKAERISDYMNYQLLFENSDWETDLDHLLTRLSLIGFVCKKSFYDPLSESIKDELCNPEDLIINSDIKSLKDARRISHVLHFRLNDLIEFKNSKLFCKEPIDKLIEQHKEDELDPKIDVVEQHTFLDLDEDNYSEPYIVTVLKETGEVLRIAPRFTSDNIFGSKDLLERITPIQLFTDYHFLVSPKGKFQSVGFGILLLHLNESINTILNQLVDAGQLANMQGGYKDSRLKNLGSGDTLHDPGEFKTVKATAGVTLKEGILPVPYKEPSSVLYQLLGLLIQTGKELSSSTEVMTGSTQADNAKTGAVQLLQQEGLKVFTSIQKRLYRSLTDEFRKIYDLNSRYLDPEVYYNILDDRKAIRKSDFELSSVDVIPTADPNLSSAMQRSERMQVLLAAQQLPGTNKIKLTELALQTANLGVPVKDIMVPPEALNKPDPAMIELQAKIQNMSETNALKGHELKIREQELQVEFYRTQCQCLELKAKAMLEIAQAQSQKDQAQFNEYKLQLDALSQHMDMMQNAAKFGQENSMHMNEMNMRQQEVDNANQQDEAPDMAGGSSDSKASE